MAKVSGPGLSVGMRGSVGGMQYRKTSRGTIALRYKNKPVTVSAPQAVIRACMLSIATLWRTLSAEQLFAWRSAGSSFNFRWGGFAYSTYLNMPRCRDGLPLLAWPPGWPLAASVWELAPPDRLQFGLGLSPGVSGLFEVAPDGSVAPSGGTAADTYFGIDIDGNLQPLAV